MSISSTSSRRRHLLNQTPYSYIWRNYCTATFDPQRQSNVQHTSSFRQDILSKSTDLTGWGLECRQKGSCLFCDLFFVNYCSNEWTLPNVCVHGGTRDRQWAKWSRQASLSGVIPLHGTSVLLPEARHAAGRPAADKHANTVLKRLLSTQRRGFISHHLTALVLLNACDATLSD